MKCVHSYRNCYRDILLYSIFLSNCSQSIAETKQSNTPDIRVDLLRESKRIGLTPKDVDAVLSISGMVSCPSSRGAGVLVSAKQVLTVAHVVTENYKDAEARVKDCSFRTFTKGSKSIPISTKAHLVHLGASDLPQESATTKYDFDVKKIVFELARSPAFDYAILTLNGTISNMKYSIILPQYKPKNGDELWVVSPYLHKTNGLAQAQKCSVEDFTDYHEGLAGLAFTKCVAEKGMSGSPIFTKVDSKLALVGILQGWMKVGSQAAPNAMIGRGIRVGINNQKNKN